MRFIQWTCLALLISTSAVADETDEKWIFVKELPQMIREQVPQVTLGGSVGSIGTASLGSSVLGRRSTIYTVKSQVGFPPDIIKAAVDKWCQGKFSQVFGSSNGTRKNGFVSHDWAYHHEESGIVGRITLWFTDTKAETMKMIVIIDERKESAK